MGIAVLNLVGLLFQIYTYMLFAYILMSWIPNLRESRFGEVLGMFVEPILAPFRKIIPPLGMIDISPIVAIIAVRFAGVGAQALVRMIFGL
ncbi:YggT family protein [Bacillus horti]|uniref:YggT family protein n=1 Tax=Caldalkalibacillus horti TaxID=77523 RepID=A0ABT9VUH5_9BACI|nr:YggT family protein [Bacillus horti]MDQ0164624.1 YggT family protein [Bacillus horti]